MNELRNLAVTLLLVLIPNAAWAQNAPAKTSPFEMVRWVEDTPEVLLQSTWYRPISIEGVSVQTILAFCKQRWPGRMKKRFGEDLPEALELMRRPLPARVDLELERISDKQRVFIEDVQMSASNRRAILQANRNGAIDGRNPPTKPVTSSYITRQQALADITDFQRGLDDQFAYRNWRGIELDRELDSVRASLPDQVEVSDLVTTLNRVMSRFGDGHARVTAPNTQRASFYPPFLIEETPDGFVALTMDRSRLLDETHPYILAIDGTSIEDWLEIIRPNMVDGSPQLVRARSTRALRDLEFLRAMTDRNANNHISIELGSEPTDPNPIELQAPMTRSRPVYGTWPRRDSSILEQNIGYLRIERMDRRLLPAIRASMEAFRDTQGLIIDLRGNGGGSRDVLIAIAGYLKAPTEKPWVGNVARYRLSDRFDRDHLDARFMYRADHPKWTDEQRRTIKAFTESFEPEWNPGEGFSEWHYLILDNTGDESEYFYDKPVAILVDPTCFSATDIFLGALRGRPRVTLMGRASGGGSARSQGFGLPHSGIEVRCASMASFRPDGRLYDGRGVEVDIEVSPVPRDFINGGGDTLLDAAIKQILMSK